MVRDDGVYIVTINTTDGGAISFRTDEWNEIRILERLAKEGKTVALIDRRFCDATP